MTGTTGLAGTTWDSNVNDRVNTFTAALKQNIIEDKLDLKLSYVYSLTNGVWNTRPFFYNGYVASANPLDDPNPTYPDTRDFVPPAGRDCDLSAGSTFVQRWGGRGMH